MKKTLLLAALLIGGLSKLSAQCTITPGCTYGATGYCTTPAENTALPNGTELVAYSTTIQLSLDMGIAPFVTFTDATISGVSGLVAGLSYATNPTSGTFLPGTSACLIITGTPAASTAGTYTVGLAFDVNTSLGATTQTLNFDLTIDPAGTTNINSITQTSNLMIAPNPATSELIVASTSHFGKVQIIDALGKTVLTHDANYTAQTSINISSLSKGVYFIQVSDGSKITTRKFIKD
jgi:hypothetical protein